jgi:hypothetical protein
VVHELWPCRRSCHSFWFQQNRLHKRFLSDEGSQTTARNTACFQHKQDDGKSSICVPTQQHTTKSRNKFRGEATMSSAGKEFPRVSQNSKGSLPFLIYYKYDKMTQKLITMFTKAIKLFLFWTISNPTDCICVLHKIIKSLTGLNYVSSLNYKLVASVLGFVNSLGTFHLYSCVLVQWSVYNHQVRCFVQADTLLVSKQVYFTNNK